MNLAITLILITLLTSCNYGKKNTHDAQQFFVINYENTLENKKTINLTDIATSVRYIPLQTDSNCLISGTFGFHFTSNYIFFENGNHVLKFDNKGHFSGRIGTPGKGPNEIDYVMSVSSLEKEELIVIKTLRKILYFDFNGNFVESIEAPKLSFAVYALQKDTLLVYDLCSNGFEDYFFRLTNRYNDTLGFVSNPYKWDNNTGRYAMMTFGVFFPFYRYNDSYFFKCTHNDTVFTIIEGKIKPAYFIDLGKYALPIDMRPENPSSSENFERVKSEYFFASALEASDKLFIFIRNYKGDISKNLLYDKSSSESIFLVKEYDEESGFINDWDNGPEFWPHGMVDDNTMFMALSPIKIKELVEAEEFTNGTANEKNRKALAELAGRLKEEDNAVLMMVTIK